MFEQYLANQYVRALVVLVFYLFLFRTGLWLIERIALILSSKTKTDIDDKLAKGLSKPLTLLALFISLIISLNELSLSEGVHNAFVNIIHSCSTIVVAYMIYVVTDVLLIHILKKIASRTNSRIDDSLLSLFHSVLNLALIAISLLYILDLWGIEIGPVLAGLGIAGLAVALALQPILSNIFSGAAIILDQSVRVGDLVYLDANTKGNILKVGLRSTKIKTFDNELIIVPNTKLSESVIQNVSLPEPKLRVVIPFSVAYGSNIEKVKKVVLGEISKIKDTEKDPAPSIRFLKMSDSSINFEAYFHVKTFNEKLAAIDEANTRIYNALSKNKIRIPFPQMDVHLKK